MGEGIYLTQEDEAELLTLEEQSVYLRSCVTAVVEGYDCGLYVYGEGGIGKSYTIQQELDRLSADYVLHNTKLTARGLMNQLQENPDSVHWIEDAEDALKQPTIDGLLRSATYSQGNRLRPIRSVTWSTANDRFDIQFTGGIIIVSNQPPDRKSGIARAVGTRFNTIDFSITQSQMIAMMKNLCLQGYTMEDDEDEDEDLREESSEIIITMNPDECWEVVEFIQKQLTEMRSPLSLRLIKQGWRDYLFSLNHPEGISWQDKLRGRMTERPSGKYKNRKETISAESEIARMIYAKPMTFNEKVAEWRSVTNKSQAAFARALKR